MGIDFLDMTFRLEKGFRLKIGKGEMYSFFEERHLNEISAGDVCDFIEEQLRAKGLLRPAGPAPFTETEDVDAMELPAPWCFISTVWPEVQVVLSDTLGVKIEKVKRESLLVRDLGMS